MKSVVEIYTDGACRGNPGPGGWGVLLRYKDKEKTLWGGELETTNNRMELLATIQGLAAVKRACKIKLTTDSKYVQQGITQWIIDWKRRAWKTANKKPVKNIDLWQRLDALCAYHQVSWYWVKGHAGHPENECADALANRGLEELLQSQ